MGEPVRDVIERLLVTQQEHWRRGRRTFVEVLLQQTPAVSPRSPDVLDLIYNEVFLRERAGEAPKLPEYVRRFPHFQEQLELQFEVHQALRPQDFAATAAARPNPAALTPTVQTSAPAIPGYEILGEIGRGSMGVVYRARQVSLRRVVALKMILRGDGADSRHVARFRVEAEAVARMQHPSIVQIFEVGEYQGKPFFSLELVEGGSLAKKLASGTPSFTEAARIVESLARGIHVAHQRGIVHRDLKPANVLITREGVPKITDFGLAKRLHDPSVSLTQLGEIVGTPSYMAAEQARGARQEIGPATDVYALGAILYEMLTGRPPFIGKTVMEVILRAADEAATPPSRIRRQVPRDLEAICMKCLEKQPIERYPSAAALADDLRRYLDGKPSAVRDAGMSERGWMWARRRPSAAALAGVFVLALAGLAAGTWLHGARVRHERNLAVQEHDVAVAERDRARQALEESVTQRDAATRARAEAEAQRDATARARAEVEQHHVAGRALLDQSRRNVFALELLQVGSLWARDPDAGLELLSDSSRCPPDLRDFTWGLLRRRCGPARRTLAGHRGPVLAVRVAPDGKRLATAGADHSIIMWNLETDAVERTLTGHVGRVYSLAFSRDGKRLASAGADHVVKLWDLTTGNATTLRGHDGAVLSVAFSPDGSALVSTGEDGTLRIWDPISGKSKAEPLPVQQGPIHCVTLSQNGKLMATAGGNRTVRLWDVAAVKPRALLTGHEGRVYAAAFDPEGKVLATAGNDGKVKLWDTTTGAEKITLTGHAGRTFCLAFSPSGRRLATGAASFAGDPDQATGEVKLWDPVSGREQATLPEPGGAVHSLAFLPDNQTLAIATAGPVVLSDVPPGLARLVLRKHEDAVMAVAFAPDARTVASASLDKSVCLWDVATGKVNGNVNGHEQGAMAVAFAPNGTTAASASADGIVQFWNPLSGRVTQTLKAHPEAITTLAFSPDSKTLATGSGDRTVKLWDVASRKLRQTLEGHADGVTSVAFAPDGLALASASGDGTVRLWDPATGEKQSVVQAHHEVVLAVAFAADGRTLVTGSGDGTAKLWDVAALLQAGPFTPRATLRSHRGLVWSVAFSPDGRTLATAAGREAAGQLDGRGEIKLWDPVTGLARATLTEHGEAVVALAFAPNGRDLASASLDRTVRLWRAVVPETVALADNVGPVRALAFAPDGKTLLSAGAVARPEAQDQTGEVELWKTSTGNAIGALKGLAGAVRCVAFSPDGRMGAAGTTLGDVKIWDASSGRELRTPGKHMGPVLAAAFSPRNDVLATAGWDGTVKLWDPGTGALKATLAGHRGPVLAVAFAGDGKIVATGGQDHVVRLWEVTTGKARGELKGHAGPVEALAFGPGQRLASGAGSSDLLHHTHVGEIRLWHLGTQKLLFALRGHSLPVRALAFSDDARLLLSGTAAEPSTGGEAKLWDLETAKEKTTFNRRSGGVVEVRFGPQRRLGLMASDDGIRLVMLGADKEVGFVKRSTAAYYAAALSPDGTTIATGSGRQAPPALASAGEARTWDPATAQVRLTLREPDSEILCAAFSPDGHTIALAGRDRRVKLLDAATGKPRLVPPGHDGVVRALAFSPDGLTIATGGSDAVVKLWDPQTGQVKGILKNHAGSILAVAYSADSKFLATSADDATVRFWEATTGLERGKIVAPGGSVTGLAFNDARTVAGACADGTIRIWNVEQAVEVRKLAAGRGPLLALALAPREGLVASGGPDGTIRVWNVATGKERARLNHAGPLAALAFSPDGRKLAAAGRDHLVILWDIPAGRP